MSKSSTAEINVGIDVGKSQLDVYIHERDLHLTAHNTPEGIRLLLARLNRYKLTRTKGDRFI